MHQNNNYLLTLFVVVVLIQTSFLENVYLYDEDGSQVRGLFHSHIHIRTCNYVHVHG